MSLCLDCDPLVVSEWTILSKNPPYHRDAEVEVTCKTGYEFQQNDWMGSKAEIKCLVDGVWNVTRIPTCKRKLLSLCLT